ncbi:hypothetical protein FQR65_LT01215 [Abscondita terminalis]|nr:hypothetical protein FQR65_LT01215 [Abscondita terminalis]
MTATDQYSLNWSNHTNHIKKAFDNLWSGNQFVDVTLSCEGQKITAHKMILSACSVYFNDLFQDNPCQHPIVILRDVKFNNLVNILKFIYSGEVNVATETFEEFLKTAELLQISGLIDEDKRTTISEKDSERVDVSQCSKKLEKQVLNNEVNIDPVKQNESTRKRLSDVNNGDNISEKKKKDSDVRLDVEIKQEAADDDNFVNIKDPLDLEEPSDATDSELLQPDKQSSKNTPIKEEKVSIGTSVPAIPNSLRYTPTSYPPLVITHVPTQIPSTEKKQYPTRKCRYCPGRKETRWQCVPCGKIPLHRENCFEIYHNKLLYN